MTVVVTGAGGLLGTALAPALAAAGHEVRRLRQGAGPGTWDALTGRLDAQMLVGADAVVHLAAESIAGRWSAARRRRIRESRVVGTQALATALSRLPTPPRVLVSASAVGWYGDRGETVLTEQAGPGRGFLAEVAEAWEAAAEPARQRGIRVVHPRLSMVLARGGALAAMLPAFRLGLGGPVGPGRQWWSWIGLDDAVGALLWLLDHDGLCGPVNVTAPDAVACAEFARTLGRVLGRPARVPLPAWAARLVLGPMADELLLSSQRVAPERLLASGFRFTRPDLESALRHALGRL